MGLAARIGTMARRGSPLPYDAEVEWIGNSGTQWIKTGVLFNSLDIGVELTVSLENNIQTEWHDEFLGCMDSDGNGSSCLRLRRYSATEYCDFSFCDDPRGVPVRGFYIPVMAGFVTLKLKHGYCGGFRNGIKIDEYVTSKITKVPCGREIYLFCGNNANSPFRVSTGMKVSSLTIFNGSDVVLDAIPVRVGANGCMYDRVSNRLLENAGSGAFVIGPDKLGTELAGGGV